MRLKSNGGTMVVTHKEKMSGYHKNIWFSKRAETIDAEGSKNLSTKSTGKIRNILIAIRRDIHQRVAQRQKRTMTMHLFHLGPAKQKV